MATMIWLIYHVLTISLDRDTTKRWAGY